MKVLTGFLLPTAGSARIGGLDVVRESLATQR
jgi:ABC-type multidrug transport system ATPase subunit